MPTATRPIYELDHEPHSVTLHAMSVGTLDILGEVMKIRLSILAVLLAATACAKRPDAIVPVDIPMAAYSNLDCGALAQELVKEQNNLAALSKQQNQAATGDAVGVFLIGVPASSTFGGDKEGQVAVSKGKVNALNSSIAAKGCKSSKPRTAKSPVDAGLFFFSPVFLSLAGCHSAKPTARPGRSIL